MNDEMDKLITLLTENESLVSVSREELELLKDKLYEADELSREIDTLDEQQYFCNTKIDTTENKKAIDFNKLKVVLFSDSRVCEIVKYVRNESNNFIILNGIYVGGSLRCVC